VDRRDFRTPGSDSLRVKPSRGRRRGACAACNCGPTEGREGRTEDNQLCYGVSKWPSAKASRV